GLAKTVPIPRPRRHVPDVLALEAANADSSGFSGTVLAHPLDSIPRLLVVELDLDFVAGLNETFQTLEGRTRRTDVARLRGYREWTPAQIKPADNNRKGNSGARFAPAPHKTPWNTRLAYAT